MSSIKTSPVKKEATPNPSPTKRVDVAKNEAKEGNEVGEEGLAAADIGDFDEDPSILSDPEDYLDENETLDMNLSRGDQKVWLVKLPKYLMEQWSNPENIKSGKLLGNVKIRKDNKGKLDVRLVLDKKLPSIPQEYDIKMLNTQVRNTYAFTEENLKKFKQELTEVSGMPTQPVLKDVDEKKKKKFQPRRKFKYFRVQKNGENGGAGPIRKYIPFVKTIPKKTSLLGKVCHDCTVVPLRNDSSYAELLKKRESLVKAPERPKVTLLNEIPGVIQSNAGPSIKGNNTSVFLKSTQPKSKSEGRAIRMPRKDLLDLLFRCFEEYEYWSIKGLKERTKQPESYLKESLESIATLIKKGPYTSKWALKAEYKKLRDAERAARLGLTEEQDKEKENEEEDDDEDMEDVI
ncbi:hypothetical protein LELG_01186 [Lodderomyces elongisporus NRRL YB-4239]|uniref:Transcription initiation factor IIF subunit beta n=1 Tax=Lodderomyces elongisporus (strain ATCC 11503 / CBS 2605 / JCM 1781 / NBRC 1676 / NRRL YB-4239) TaxID=379508 RepID=A5DV00_LODEL|nr:hypothetical protein LELG_01186 [Lodderomyces elongisporus NRRL YB-4239]